MTIKTSTAAGILAAGYLLLGTGQANAQLQTLTLTASTPGLTQGTFNIGSGALFNVGQLSATGSSTFNYTSVFFLPTASQSYTFGQSSAPVDTVMFLTQGVFDPAHPGQNALALNDDVAAGSHVAGAGVTSCGTVNFCPEVRLTVTAGQVYSIVISTFSAGATIGLPQTMYVDGPGTFSASAAALPSLPAAPAGPDPVLTALAGWNLGVRTTAAMQLQQHMILGAVQGVECAQFGANGTCVTARAAFGDVGMGGSQFRGTAAAAVRLGHGVSVGGFIDQPVATTSPGGVALRGEMPTLGAYVQWQAAEDGTGVRVRLAYAQGSGRLNLTRASLGGTEPGQGSAGLEYRSYGGELSYGMRVNEMLVARPYAGIWQTTASRGGYTEMTSASVAFPLSYARYTQQTTTATAGVRLVGQLTESLTLGVRAGIEADAASSRAQMAATSGISGLAGFAADVVTRVNRLRLTGGVGLGYAIAANQSVGVEAGVRQLPYGNTLGTSAMVNYALGF